MKTKHSIPQAGKPGREKRDATNMFPLIARWQQSKLTQKEFCVRNAIAAHVFNYWLAKYRGRDDNNEKSGSGFVALKIHGASGPKFEMEVRIPTQSGALELHFQALVPASWLGEVVQILNRC